MIFSIGYENLAPARLAELAARMKVIDTRAIRGRAKPGFGVRQLEALLGDRYEWRGGELGGFGKTTAAGLQRLAGEREHVLLLCVEAAPGDCHRHSAIGWPLWRRFKVHVHHIHPETDRGRVVDGVITAKELEAATRADVEYEWRPLAEVLP